MMVGLKRISTVVGLLAVTASASFGQGTMANPNQMTADSVASALRVSRTLSGSRIEIEAQGGLVTLTGQLATPALKAEAVARARSVAGRPGRDGPAPGRGSNHSTRRSTEPQVALGHHRAGRLHGGSDVLRHGRHLAASVSGAGTGGFVNDGGPLPEGPAGGGAGGAGAMPGNPNYAWPSYAPYPNFSAVGYPTAYPWQAWPNIGPFYPYPEVPLDWRAVTLRWDDGIWWLDFKKHYTRPFFVPYPFGIGAY